MPFDGTDTLLAHLQSQAPLPLLDFIRQLSAEFPGLRITVDGPGATGGWWIEAEWGTLFPGIEWREASGFSLYGPGPTLPERPNAVVAHPRDAAQRLARMLRSWASGAASTRLAA